MRVGSSAGSFGICRCYIKNSVLTINGFFGLRWPVLPMLIADVAPVGKTLICRRF